MASPRRSPRSRLFFGRRFVRMIIKITLSIPSKISINERLIKAERVSMEKKASMIFCLGIPTWSQEAFNQLFRTELGKNEKFQ